MAYAYLVGYMDCLKKDTRLSFEDWINEANKQIKKFNIQMSVGQLGDLMDVYYCMNCEEINDITYIIVGDYDEDDADINGDLYGIVYMENYEIKLISLANFNKLKIMEG